MEDKIEKFVPVCTTCAYEYPDCPADVEDVVFCDNSDAIKECKCYCSEKACWE